ncbi:hypothetical protein AGMMS50267_11690 [Spirochaetia bacterium]|nr:hypothetical protein AGMMS50267_11690 [Spirochaetia bacterium]
MSDQINIFGESDKTISIFDRIKLWKGVIRRFLIYFFRKNYINKNILKRQGKCIRCGACCKLAFKECPYLKMGTEGKYTCIRHESFRMPNCIIFPIDQKDISDRNKVSNESCGYYF